jgi:tetratricopeptide (TPR) repeat protein
MTKNEFEKLVDFVVNTGIKPPRVLFIGGFEDWHVRASLAKFLYHPEYNKIDSAIELFESVLDVQVSAPEDIEHKAWSLRYLSSILRKKKGNLNEALTYINASITLAESINFKYHIINRGELWAERWIILNFLHQTNLAITEADEKIAEHNSKFAKNNSYLYNAYRFKAQVAGAQGNVSDSLKLIKKALSYIKLSDEDKRNLAVPFSSKHQNIFTTLSKIDLATPALSSIAWTI